MSQGYHLHPKLNTESHLQRCDWPNCKAACCIYGVWVDKLHAKEILSHAALIAPHMHPEHTDPSCWFDGQEEDDDFALTGKVVHSTIIPNHEHYGGTACIFLRPDYKCALQVTADENGLHPWRFKPFYCILHPLDLEEDGRITLGEEALLAEEPASCLRSSEQPRLLSSLFPEELAYFIQEDRSKHD